MTDPAPLVVLEGYAQILPTTNPYITQLDRALRGAPGIEVLRYSPRHALLGRYDVLHVHWPENMFGGRTRAGRVARRLLTLAILARLTLVGTPVVRTAHNLHRPDGLGRTDHLLLSWIDRLTAVQIRLSDATDLPVGSVRHTIPHGHYRDWYAPFPRSEPVPRRLGFVGLIRRYKGVEELVGAFGGLDDADASLEITGKPSTEALATTITELAAADPRVHLHLEFVDEAGFAAAMTRAQLVVLPYQHMHNSGAALAALSLDRPVLVPDTEVNRALAAEVGPGWVHLFSGAIGPDDLRAALDAVTRLDPAARPDLSRRGWDTTAEAHHAAFLEAAAGRARVR